MSQRTAPTRVTAVALSGVVHCDFGRSQGVLAADSTKLTAALSKVEWAAGMDPAFAAPQAPGRGPMLPSPETRAHEPQLWPEERDFVCRGKEGGTLLHYDHPRGKLGLHLVRLFITGTPPRAPDLTLQDVINWDAQPEHSYVADGAGGLAVAAHPVYADKDAIRSLRGLTAIELTHCGDCGFADRLWDELLRERLAAGDPPLWGFGGDDTHSTEQGQCGLSWVGIKARRRHTAELKRALREGAVYASNGVVIRDFRVEARTVTVECDRPCEVRWMRAGQYYDGLGLELRRRYAVPCEPPMPADVLRLLDPTVGPEPGPNRCVSISRGVMESSYTVNREDGTGDAAQSAYVRCVVLDSQDLSAWRRFLETGRSTEELKAARLSIRKAFSMPFLIQQGGRVKSPYPSDGVWLRGMTHNHADLCADRVQEASRYHAAYRAQGIEAAFETGYCYWFFPYLHYPSSATPIVREVRPDRVEEDSDAVLEIAGENLPARARVLIAGREVPAEGPRSGARLRVRAPHGLKSGVYDVTVRDVRGPYQDTRADAFTVQPCGARNRGWTRFGREEGLPDEHVYFLGWLEGGLWAGTRNGFALFEGDRFVPVAGGPVNSEAITLDAEGRLWASGWDSVQTRAPDGAWRRWTEADGLLGFGETHASFHHLIRTRSGEVLLSHYRPGRVSVFDGRRWREERVLTGARHNAVTSLAEWPDGRVFAGSHGHGILERGTEGWRTAASVSTPPARSPRRIYFDRHGRMALACAEDDPAAPGGIQILEGGRWRVIGRNEGLPGARVWALAFEEGASPEGRGAIWAATCRGLARVAADGSVAVFDMLNSGLPHDVVTDVSLAPDGCVWVATGRGVARLNPKTNGRK